MERELVFFFSYLVKKLSLPFSFYRERQRSDA